MFKCLLALYLVCVVTHNIAQVSQSPTQISGNMNPTSIYAAGDSYFVDFDNDGDEDLICAINEDESYRSKLIWFENVNGDFLTQKTICSNIRAQHGYEITDIDQDGDMDVIVSGNRLPNQLSSSSKYIFLFKNYGGQQFSAPINLGQATSSGDVVFDIETFDFDMDGDIDIFFSNSENELHLIENLGQAMSWSNNLFMNVNTIGEFEIFDVNEDGNLDILYSSHLNSSFGYIAWLENLGGGNFNSTISSIAFGLDNIDRFVLRDLDNDGKKDILANSGGNDNFIFWIQNLGSGSFSGVNIIANNILGNVDLAAMDYNNDNLIDAVFSSNGFNEIYWCENLGSGTFGPKILISDSYAGPENFVVSDIDNDSDEDLVFSSSTDFGRLILERNNGNGSFESSNLVLEETFSYSAVFCDWDQDGDQDIFASVGFDFENKLVYYENLGFQNFKTPVIVDSILGNGSFNSLFCLDVGDIDVDGDDDLMVTLKTEDAVVYYRNEGDGKFDSLFTLVGSSTYPINYAFFDDFDFDGDDDIFISYPNGMRFQRNDSGMVFSFPTYVGGITNNRDPELALLSGDSLKDAVFIEGAGFSSISYSIYSGGFWGVETEIINVGEDVYHLEVKDVNNDSLPDIIYSTSSDLYLSLNLGSLTFSSPQSILNLPSSNQHDINVFDFNGDIYPDIILTGNHYIKILFGDSLNTFQQTSYLDTLHDFLQVEFGDIDNDGDDDILTPVYTFNHYYYEGVNYFENHKIPFQFCAGNIYLDSNSNGIWDSLEIGLPNCSVSSDLNGIQGSTNSIGQYQIDLGNNSFQNFNLGWDSIPFWIQTSGPSTYFIDYDSSFIFQNNLDFGIKPDSIVPNLFISLVGGFPRCNDTVLYSLSVQNIGTTIPSGPISITFDDSLTYFTSSESPDSIIGQTYYFHYDNLNYFQSKNLDIQIIFPDFNSDGLKITSSAKVGIDSMDFSTFYFVDTLRQTVICAYDPNVKTSDPIGIDSPGYIDANQEQIEYTITFQNTGSDTAQNVIIKDLLDPSLNWNSISIVGSSFPCTYEVNSYGLLNFYFDDINLPDSNVDFNGSIGYVSYIIEIIDSLPTGTQIFNSADIYFDQNPGVITNTKTLTLFDCSGLVNYASYSDSVCRGDSVAISVSPSIESPINFIWTHDNTNVGNDTILTIISQNDGWDSVFFYAENDICQVDSIFYYFSFPNPVISEFYASQDSTCQNNILLLYGMPLGGDFSGAGVDSNEFNSGITGPGDFMVYYSLLDSNNCAIEDSLTIHVNDCFVGLGENSASDEEFKAFPNPASKLVHLIFHIPNEKQITILDLKGQQIKDFGEFQSQETSLSISDITPGTYIILVKSLSTGTYFRKKLVIY